MSDLSATQWSETVLQTLRQFELQCPDDDLFCVGYVIPQVELLEMNRHDQSAEPEQWQVWLAEFVEGCMAVDQVSDQDATRIREIVASLA